MKFKIQIVLLALLLCNAIGLQAQTHDHFECGLIEGDQNMSFSTLATPSYSGSVNPLYLAEFPKITFNIYFWIIKRTNGTTDYPVTKDQVLLEVERVNEFFHPMGICFVLQGIGDINNDGIYPPGTFFSTVSSYATNNNYVKSNSFNVYIHPDIGDANGVTNYGSNRMAIDTWVLQGLWEAPRSITAHELAHTFGLYHVWGANNGWIDADNDHVIDPGEMIPTEEHVTRDPANVNYNALTHGDRVADTGAMNPMNIEAMNFGLNIDDVVDQDTCEYIGPGQDTLGVPFSLTPADVGNPMQYGVSDCVLAFTTGQGIRIREYIEGSPTASSVLAMRTNNTSIVLSTPETNTAFIHQYFNTIVTNTNYQVASGKNINLKAGDYISLEPNTDINSGSIFVAEIEKCECDPNSPTFRVNMAVESTASTFEETTAMKLYPNPNNGTFDITLAKEINGNINVEVYDISGKVIYRDSKQGTTLNISVPNLSSGMYIVRLSSGDYNETIKFVKN